MLPPTFLSLLAVGEWYKVKVVAIIIPAPKDDKEDILNGMPLLHIFQLMAFSDN